MCLSAAAVQLFGFLSVGDEGCPFPIAHRLDQVFEPPNVIEQEGRGAELPDNPAGSQTSRKSRRSRRGAHLQVIGKLAPPLVTGSCIIGKLCEMAKKDKRLSYGPERGCQRGRY